MTVAGSGRDGSGEQSKYTLLIYLNTGYSGGYTTLYNCQYDVGGYPQTPVVGMALVHDHRIWHESPPLIEGVKYVIRTDVMYAPA